jgi:hypothetical protein
LDTLQQPTWWQKEQENAVDEALWVAVPIIEERAELVARMAEYGGAAAKLSPKCMRIGPSNTANMPTLCAKPSCNPMTPLAWMKVGRTMTGRM